jgi:hypothetical protein
MLMGSSGGFQILLVAFVREKINHRRKQQARRSKRLDQKPATGIYPTLLLDATVIDTVLTIIICLTRVFDRILG